MSARIKPHKVRRRELEEIREVDPDGRIVVHHRLVDTLGRMLKSGTIDQAMHLKLLEVIDKLEHKMYDPEKLQEVSQQPARKSRRAFCFRAGRRFLGQSTRRLVAD
jgi:hypothetical protein